MIPYTVERRHDTGVNNVTLAIWLFLASEAMLFAALFSAYALLRIAAPAWPRGSTVLSLSIGAGTTVAMAMMLAAAWGVRSASTSRARVGLAVSALFALVSLGLMAAEYRGAISRGLVPSASTFAAMYYTLTGVHGLHIAGGVVATAWVMAGARRVSPFLTSGRVQALSLYWAFVTSVWLVIFALMYLS